MSTNIAFNRTSLPLARTLVRCNFALALIGVQRMKIDGTGFLNNPLPDIERTVPGANRALFDVLVDLCAFAEKLKAEIAVQGQETPEEKQRTIAAIVLVRLLEIVQSVAILAAHGVREELDSMFRVFLDAYFVLANCCNNAEFIPVYFRTDLPARLKLLNVASKHQTDLFKLVNEYATADMKGELDSKIKAEKIDAFNSYLFAQNVGCEQIYDSMYRLLSASVHTTPRCLQHYVESDAEGNITTVLHCPDSHTTDRVVFDISWFFIKALRGVLESFEIPQSRELDNFESRLKAVVADERRNPAPTRTRQKAARR